MSMKYRVAIEIPGVPVNETTRWQPLAAHLEAFHGALGPVVAWRGSQRSGAGATGNWSGPAVPRRWCVESNGARVAD
jgi:hypothetical protein